MYSASVSHKKQAQYEFQVIKREDDAVIAYCPSQSHAIRIAMALNLMDRQATMHGATFAVSVTQTPSDHEMRCENCSHRFPAARIGTVRVIYGGREEAYPCCPMCGEILPLDATTSPTYDEWWERYRK